MKKYLNKGEHIIKQFHKICLTNRKLIHKSGIGTYYIYYNKINCIKFNETESSFKIKEITITLNNKTLLGIKQDDISDKYTILEVSNAISEQVERFEYKQKIKEIEI